MFDQISGYYGPLKLMHKISHLLFSTLTEEDVGLVLVACRVSFGGVNGSGSRHVTHI